MKQGGCVACSLCSKPCSDAGESSSEPARFAEKTDDSFVVLDDEIWSGGKESGAALERLVLLKQLGGHGDDGGVGMMTESVRRQQRLTSRALSGRHGGCCARCADAMRELLEHRLANARHEAELYASCERLLAMARDDDEIARAESQPKMRTSRRRAIEAAKSKDTEGDELIALQAALAVARHEARATRAALEDVRSRTSALDADDEALWRAASALDSELGAFRDDCADLCARADKRQSDDGVVEALATALASIDKDRASFETIDAYVRTACRELSALLHDAA